MRRSFKFASVVLAGITAAAFAGCAGQGDVDRTQPGRISKAVFSGEWYYRQYIHDAPATSNSAYEGEATSMDRVRWKITETALIAYRSYATTPGVDNPQTQGANDLTAPVAAFPIQSHFDVKRSYNSSTGEQTNVLYEDTSDRPWYQRDYIRVDWTTNSVSGFSIPGNPEAYVAEVDKTIDPDRALITEGLIDVTTRFILGTDCGDADSYDNCSPVSVKVRSSFLKIDAINKAYLALDDQGKPSYEPLEYRDGVLLTDDAGKIIPAIALNSGQAACTPTLLSQLSQQAGATYTAEEDCTPARMEMFQKFGYFRTERDTFDRDFGLTESGKIYLINRWNIWSGNTKTATGSPVPYLQRTPRTLTYYLNTTFPDNLAMSAKHLGDDYDKAFQDTVAALRLTEANCVVGPDGVCRGQPVTQDEIDAEKAAFFGTTKHMFQVKQNSCNLKGLPELAGMSVQDWANAHPNARRDAVARMNDAGLTLKPDLSDLAPATLRQFCTSLEDVTLNEKKAEDRFVWQRPGDLRFSFINWVDRYQPTGPLGLGPADPDPTTGEYINAMANIYGAALDNYAASSVEMVQVLNGEIMLSDLIRGQDILTNIAATADRRKQQEAQPFDSAKLNKLFDMLPTSEQLKDLRTVAPGFLQRRLETIKGTQLENMLVTPDIAMLDPNYKPGDEITQDVINRVSPVNWAFKEGAKNRDRKWKNAMNPARGGCEYLAEFADDSIVGWALEQKGKMATREAMLQKAREDIFLGVTEHEVGHTMGLRHNFEGSMDALNYWDDYWAVRASFPKTEWASHKLSEFGYSTVMDYSSHFNSDVHGLGKYDYAAIKFGYGQLVETFPPAAVGTAGDVLRDQLFTGNYEDIPKASLFKNPDNIKLRTTEPYSNLVKFETDELKAGHTANTREVPYRFCSDEYNGSLTCKTWDEGASQAEVVQNAISMYHNYWYFRAFKRDRINWSVDGYMSTLSGRYFDKFSTAFQYFFYYGSYYRNTFFGQDLARASVDGMNTLNEVLATPDTGDYCLAKAGVAVAEPNVYKQYGTNCDPTTTINLNYFNGAKPFYLDFDNDYYYHITRAGAMYDKLIALEALTDSTAKFFRVDTYGDRRNFSINYYRSWKEPMLSMIEGLVLDNNLNYTGTVQAGKYVPPQVIDYVNANTGLMSPPTTLPKMRSRVNYTVQYYTLFYTMAALNNTLDDTADISNYMKISKKGSTDDVTYDATAADLIEITNPETHETYRAVNTPDGKAVGYKLLKQAQDYLNGTYTPAFNAYTANPTGTNLLTNFQTAQRTLTSMFETADDVRLFNAYFASGQR